MNEKEYLELVRLSDKLERRASIVFDKLNESGILPGNFYVNKMIPIKIDNITQNNITLEYFDDGYDIREEREITIPVDLIFDDDKLEHYINNILDKRAQAIKEQRERQETEEKKRRYETYVELKKEFENEHL